MGPDYSGQVLSALLPGVREFRTPLVTGSLWAACLWLLFGMPIADSSATRDFVDSFGLAGLPPTVWFGASALLVYLVGSLLVVRTSPMTWLSRRLRPRVHGYFFKLEDQGAELTKRHQRWVRKLLEEMTWSSRWLGVIRRWGYDGDRYQEVDAWLHNEFQGMAAEGRVPVMRSFEGGCNAPSGFEAFYATDTVDAHPAIPESYDLRSVLAQNFVREVKQEQAAVEVRIQMRFPEVYAEIDRLKVEAELRLSIFWPLMLLSVLLAWAWSPSALVLALVPPFLLRDAWERRRQASEKTWGALVAGEVTTPILDAMANAKNEDCRDFGARYRRAQGDDESHMQAVS